MNTMKIKLLVEEIHSKIVLKTYAINSFLVQFLEPNVSRKNALDKQAERALPCGQLFTLFFKCQVASPSFRAPAMFFRAVSVSAIITMSSHFLSIINGTQTQLSHISRGSIRPLSCRINQGVMENKRFKFDQFKSNLSERQSRR